VLCRCFNMGKGGLRAPISMPMSYRVSRKVVGQLEHPRAMQPERWITSWIISLAKVLHAETCFFLALYVLPIFMVVQHLL